MTPEPSAWTKFTWHGVDIVANVASTLISALIVWGVATIFVTWRHKQGLQYEAKKLEQEKNFKAEVEKERKAEEASQYVQQLVRKRDDLAQTAEAGMPALQEFALVKEDLLPWLFSTGLIEHNRELAHKIEMAYTIFTDTKKRSTELPEQIRAIKIPGEVMSRKY